MPQDTRPIPPKLLHAVWPTKLHVHIAELLGNQPQPVLATYRLHDGRIAGAKHFINSRTRHPADVGGLGVGVQSQEHPHAKK